jgi:hypothetical protein
VTAAKEQHRTDREEREMGAQTGGWVIRRHRGDSEEYYQGRQFGAATWTPDAHVACVYGADTPQRIADELGDGAEPWDYADACEWTDEKGTK